MERVRKQLVNKYCREIKKGNLALEQIDGLYTEGRITTREYKLIRQYAGKINNSVPEHPEVIIEPLPPKKPSTVKIPDIKTNSGKATWRLRTGSSVKFRAAKMSKSYKVKKRKSSDSGEL